MDTTLHGLDKVGAVTSPDIECAIFNCQDKNKVKNPTSSSPSQIQRTITPYPMTKQMLPLPRTSPPKLVTRKTLKYTPEAKKILTPKPASKSPAISLLNIKSRYILDDKLVKFSYTL